MITLNTIVKRFEDFADNHFFIRSFSFGGPEDVDLEKFDQYPLLHLIYTGATYEDTTKTLDFEVYIFDLPSAYENKNERQKEVVSDAEQCAEDILADIANGHNIFIDSEDYEVANATVTPLQEANSNVLAGVLLELSITLPYDRSACDAPINGVQPEGGGFVYQRRGLLRVLTQNGAVDVLSVNTIKVTNGTLTDEGNGVVSIDTGGGGAEYLDGLLDVVITDPLDHDALVYDEVTGDWINGAPKALDLPIYNATASPILKGRAVKATGSHGDKVSVGLYSNTDDPKVFIGLTTTEIAAGGTGHARTYGELRGISTNAYPIGTILYCGTLGQLTDTEPVGKYARIAVATVTRSQQNTGRIYIRTWQPQFTLNSLADVYYDPLESWIGSPIVLAWNTTLQQYQRQVITLTATLAGLTDVDVRGVVNNAALVYNSTTTKWEDKPLRIENCGDVTYIPASTSNGAILQWSSTLQKWTAPPKVGKTPAPAGEGQFLIYVNTAGEEDSTNGLRWDEATDRLAIGKTTPTEALDVVGNIAVTGTVDGRDIATDGTKLDGIGAGATVVSVTGTAPIVSSGGANPAISITAATTSAAGSMSSSDKTKLDGIEAGAEVNQNAFSNIAVAGQSTVAADSKTDTFTLVAGTNITLTTDASTDSITIAASGGAPAGSTGQIQYNSGGAFAAENELFYDATNNRLSVGGDTTPAGTITSRGAGDTTGIALQTENSSGVARVVILDEGTMTITEATSGMAATRPTISLKGNQTNYFRPCFNLEHNSLTTPFTSLNVNNKTGGSITINDWTTGGIAATGTTSNSAGATPFFFAGYHGSTTPTAAAILFQFGKHNNSGSGTALASSEVGVRFSNFGTVNFVQLGSGATGIRNTAPTSTTTLTVRGQGTSTNNTLLIENSAGTARFTVRDDGGYAFAGGTVGVAQTGYTTFTNLTTDRTCDANATTVEELADILGTLIVDLKTKGIIAA